MHIRRIIQCLGGAALVAAGASAEETRFRLKDGRVLEGDDLTVRDNRLVRVLSSGTAPETVEVAVPISSVVALECPLPEGLSRAREALARGAAAQALTELETVIAAFAPFRGVKGSWWREAELMRARALRILGRREEARRAAEAVVAADESAGEASRARVLLAALALDEGRDRVAEELARDWRRGELTPEADAEAALLAGNLALRRERWDEALDSFLQIPVFHGGRDDLMPAALLGSARAYRGRKDDGRAERAALDVMDGYGHSPEADIARKEMAR